MFANILKFALPRACIVHFRVLIKSVRVRVLRYFSAFRFRKGIKIKTESFAIQDRHALKERKQMIKYHNKNNTQHILHPSRHTNKVTHTPTLLCPYVWSHKKNYTNPKLLLKNESTYLQTQFTVNSQNDATLTKK